MTISSLSKLMIETHAKLPIFSKINWLGRQVLALGKSLYSQLVNITNLFYHIIKAHAKEALITLTATTVSLVIYYNRKPLKTFLKSLYPETQKTIHQQKTKAFLQQFSKGLETIQKLLPNLENTISLLETNISIINAYQESLIEKRNQIKKDFIAIKECSTDFNPLQPTIIQPKETYELLEKRILALQELETSIQDLIIRAQEFIKNTNEIKEGYHQLSNPFTP